MSWLDSLDASIAEALNRYPEQVEIASLVVEGETFLVTRQSLQNMQRMQLGHLPISTVALPYHLSDILTRPHEENLIRDYSRHLSDFFPNFFVAAIYELQSLFASQNVNAYIIGGVTRDMLLSSERRYDVQDVDIIIEGNAIEVARWVDSVSRNFDLIEVFEPFGTAKMDYKGEIHLDFASTRKEIYPACGALPQIVELGVPLEEDIIRRDFTINALALSVRNPGQVVDCTGGLCDLEQRKIRLLKAESFFEDPSRIIRAFKFSTRMAFSWGEDTDWILDRFLAWMPKVYKGGGDRIRYELQSLLSLPESPAKTQWLTTLVERGLHRLIDTSLPAELDLPLPLVQIAGRLEIMQAQLGVFWKESLMWEVYLAFLLMGLPQKLAESSMNRLELTRHEIDVIERSFRLLNENVICPLTSFDNPVKLYDTFHPMPMGAACVGLILSPQFETNLEAFLRYKRELENVKLDITGDDILKLGVPQGEQVGQLLKAVLHAKLQGKIHNRLEEINWLKNRIAKPLEESHY